MEFKLTEDQTLLLEALDGVIGPVGEPERCNERFLIDAALERRLIDAEFFSLAQNGYSTLDAMLVALTLCRLPAAIEAAASLLVGPLLPADIARLWRWRTARYRHCRDARCASCRQRARSSCWMMRMRT